MEENQANLYLEENQVKTLEENQVKRGKSDNLSIEEGDMQYIPIVQFFLRNWSQNHVLLQSHGMWDQNLICFLEFFVLCV